MGTDSDAFHAAAIGLGWKLHDVVNTSDSQKLSYHNRMRGICARFTQEGAFRYATTRRKGVLETSDLDTALNWLQLR
ncbi:hypothetical protein [Mycolicibacterium sp.]|uniref:hypothetical protein n=1 Tax=Mycolicibacterium sp. TaxID=2320850 RepID=UPI0037CA6183